MGTNIFKGEPLKTLKYGVYLLKIDYPSGQLEVNWGLEGGLGKLKGQWERIKGLGILWKEVGLEEVAW